MSSTMFWDHVGRNCPKHGSISTVYETGVVTGAVLIHRVEIQCATVPITDGKV
jgi:hypothetical protein